MAKEIIVTAGKYHVAGKSAKLLCLGLGSCVAIVLYDQLSRIGGLAHAMLPSYEGGVDKQNPGKYVDTSIYLMVDELMDNGVKKKLIRAKVIGGAQMFSYTSPKSMDIGSQNISSAKKILKEEGISITAEDTGGSIGRTIIFNTTSGLVQIRKRGFALIEI